jgi:hypothetical protein
MIKFHIYLVYVALLFRGRELAVQKFQEIALGFTCRIADASSTATHGAETEIYSSLRHPFWREFKSNAVGVSQRHNRRLAYNGLLRREVCAALYGGGKRRAKS